MRTKTVNVIRNNSFWDGTTVVFFTKVHDERRRMKNAALRDVAASVVCARNIYLFVYYYYPSVYKYRYPGTIYIYNL